MLMNAILSKISEAKDNKVLYEKLFAISTAISGRNFGNEREAKREQLGQSVAHYTSIPKSWALRGCVSTKKQSVYTLYYHFAKYH